MRILKEICQHFILLKREVSSRRNISINNDGGIDKILQRAVNFKTRSCLNRVRNEAKNSPAL